MTAYVLRTGEPQLITLERFAELDRAGRDRAARRHDRASRAGSASRSRPKGGRSACSSCSRTRKEVRYTEQDKDLLAFVGQHVGVGALARTRDRGDAAAERRAGADQQRPGGDRGRARACRRSTTPSATRSRRSSTPRASRSRSSTRQPGSCSFPYLIERGERLSAGADALTGGFTQARARDAGAAADQREHRRESRAIRQPTSSPARCRSPLLRVPLVVGGRATGVISLENFDREHAFDESDRAADDARRAA